jgi:hypothetical protein
MLGSSETGDFNIFLPDVWDPIYCYQISPRARAFDYDGDGDWDEIFITGYATSGNFFQDYSDNLDNIMAYSGYGEYSATVTKVIEFIKDQDEMVAIDQNFWLRGHSLGAQEAVLIARTYGNNNPVARVTTYGIAINTPIDAFTPYYIPIEHYVSLNDFPLCTSSSVNSARLSAGANIHYISNGYGGWTWSANVHSRKLYQMNALLYSGVPHPIR